MALAMIRSPLFFRQNNIRFLDLWLFHGMRALKTLGLPILVSQSLASVFLEVSKTGGVHASGWCWR